MVLFLHVCDNKMLQARRGLHLWISWLIIRCVIIGTSSALSDGFLGFGGKFRATGMSDCAWDYFGCKGSDLCCRQRFELCSKFVMSPKKTTATMLKKTTPSPKTTPKPLQSGVEIELNDPKKSQRPLPMMTSVPQVITEFPRGPSHNHTQASISRNTTPSPKIPPKPSKSVGEGPNNPNKSQRPSLLPQIPADSPRGSSYKDTQDSTSKNTTLSPITTAKPLQSGGESEQINSNKDLRPLPVIPQVPQIPADFPRGSAYNVTQDPVLENTTPSPKTTPISNSRTVQGNDLLGRYDKPTKEVCVQNPIETCVCGDEGCVNLPLSRMLLHLTAN